MFILARREAEYVTRTLGLELEPDELAARWLRTNLRAFLTAAIERGADPASVAAFLNHKSPSTTRRFYATHAVPKKVPTLI